MSYATTTTLSAGRSALSVSPDARCSAGPLVAQPTNGLFAGSTMTKRLRPVRLLVADFALSATEASASAMDVMSVKHRCQHRRLKIPLT